MNESIVLRRHAVGGVSRGGSDVSACDEALRVRAAAARPTLGMPCDAALKERILAWQRTGQSTSLYDRFRSLTAVRRKDPDWRGDFGPGGRRETVLPVSRRCRDACNV